jgi:N6-adenosine-specific RNA methylase IME4
VSAELPVVPGGFKTIAADPPWPYDQKLGRADQGDKTRGGLPYEPMTLEEIRALRVGDVAASDSVVFLWATSSHLHDAFHVLEAWGFEYKAVRMAWVKNRMGLGYWLRGISEYILLGVRGNPREKMVGPHGATGLNETTVFQADIGPHSRKPPEAHVFFENYYLPPRLELFARPPLRAGWTVWGVQAGGQVQNSLDGPEEPKV